MTEGKMEKGLSEARKAEVESARQVLLSLAKADRGFSLYLPNNPLHRQFFDELRERMKGHLEKYGTLPLALNHAGMTCHGVVVYDNPDPRESLAFRLFADGMRSLSFNEGLSESELRTCLEIFSRERAKDDDEDIVTELWISELPHLSFILAEEGGEVETGQLGLRPENTSQRRQALQRIHREEPLQPPPRHMVRTPQRVFSLSVKELASIEEQARQEQERDPTEDVADILRAILLVEKETSTFREFLDTIARLCGDLILIERVDSTLHLTGLMADLAASEEVTAEHKEIVYEEMRNILSPEVIAALEGILDKTEKVTKEQLRDLVVHLGKRAIMPFCLLLGKVERRDMRKFLVDGLVAVGRSSPEDFLPFLTDERWYLVRNTVHIFRKMETASAARHVTELVTHKDQRVRREVLGYFEELEGEEGTRNVLRFLEDQVGALRVSAVKALSHRGDRGALEPLLEIMNAPGAQRREIGEREHVCEALGRLDPGTMVPLFDRMLKKRYWFRKNREWEAALCASAGLRGAGTPSALKLLKEAMGSKKGRARDVITASIEAMSASPGQDEEDR